MTVVRRIGVLSLAKVMAILYACLGLIVGGMISLVAMLGGAMGAALGGDQGSAGPFALLFGAAAIVVAPIFYGVIGFIGGLITGGLYNLVAGIAGGIELDLG